MVVSHAFMLSSGSNADEPVFRISGGQVTGGGLAVFSFFVLSGFLITRSFENTTSIRRFIAARLARLVPALAAVLVVTAVVLGPCLTSIPVAEYFAGPEWLLYIGKNLSLLVYAEGLPEVLADAPLPNIVNGSLWTLHIEAASYALIVILGVTRLLHRHVTTGFVVVGVLVTALSASVNYPVVLVTHFMAGAALYHWRVPRDDALAAGCAAVLTAGLAMGGFLAVSATAGAYLVLFVAFAPTAPGRREAGDLSYGTYIWAFPVQQAVGYAMNWQATWYANVLISLPIVLGLAWLSWNGIEKRALRWVQRRSAQFQPTPTERAAALTLVPVAATSAVLAPAHGLTPSPGGTARQQGPTGER